MRGYQVKGFHFKGILAALADEKLTADVRARVTPDVQALLDMPPIAGAWVDGAAMDAISEAVLQLGGVPRLRRVQAVAVNQGAMLVLKPVVESVMRVFGVSPATLMTHLNRLQGSAVRGITHVYRERGVSEGTLETTVEAPVPDSFFEGTAGSMEALCALCGAKAVIPAPRVLRVGDRTVGTMDVSWRK